MMGLPFTLKAPLQSFALGLKAMGLASLVRKCNRYHAGFMQFRIVLTQIRGTCIMRSVSFRKRPYRIRIVLHYETEAITCGSGREKERSFC